VAHIFKTKDGRYRVNFGGRGKRRYRREFNTRAAAEQFLESIKAGSPVDETKLRDLVAQYLHRAEKIGIKGANTIRCDRQRLGVFVDWCPVSAMTKITARTIRDFQDYYFDNAPFTAPNHRRQSNPKATWEKYRQILSAFFNWCIRRDLMKTNPLAGPAGREFKIKLQKRIPQRILSGDELTKLFQYFDSLGSPHVSAFFRLLAYTGMRLAEAMNLKWGAVDLDAGTIQVVKSKSKGVRTIPISEKLSPWLEQLPQNTEYVLDSGMGTKLYRDSHWWSLLREATNACKLKPARIHDLRHTFAASLAMQNVHIKTIQELMGHSDIHSTLIYLNFQPAHYKEAVNKLPF